MKYFLFCFIIVFVLISSQNSTDDDKYNCTIPEGKEECCWINPNGCCIKSNEFQVCTQVITQCCKNKSGTIYNNGLANDPIIPIYYQSIKINWIIILIAFIFVI